jgi:hypothetical protein
MNVLYAGFIGIGCLAALFFGVGILCVILSLVSRNSGSTASPSRSRALLIGGGLLLVLGLGIGFFDVVALTFRIIQS